MMLGAAPITAAAAFFVTGAIDRAGRVLNRWGLPAFFQQVVGGMLATGVAPQGAAPVLPSRQARPPPPAHA